MDVPLGVVEAAKRGDPDAFDQLVRETHREVYALAFRITGDREDASDVAQETYFKLLRKIKQFRGDSKFSTWLYRVTANVAISHLRRQRKLVLLPDEQDHWERMPAGERSDPAASAERTELRVELERQLMQLPLGSRAVVVLRDVYGLSLAEIGHHLGITEGAAKVRLHRARRRLQEQLGAWAPVRDEEQEAKGEGNEGAVDEMR